MNAIIDSPYQPDSSLCGKIGLHRFSVTMQVFNYLHYLSMALHADEYLKHNW